MGAVLKGKDNPCVTDIKQEPQKVLLDDCMPYYKGNMHCHSNLSDGCFTPKELKEIYKSRGYDFLAITDHDRVHVHQELTDSEFVMLTGCEISIKEKPFVSTLKDSGMKACHLNLYAKDPNNDYNVYYSTAADKYSYEKEKAALAEKYGDCVREYSAGWINRIIKKANEKGFFVCFNHPNWSLANFSDYCDYQGLWGVEIYNHGCAQRGMREYDINVFEDMLRQGKRVFASCGDDNHNKNMGLDDSFGGFVKVNCKSLTYDNIVDALQKGSFYTSCGPMITKLWVQGGKVYIKCQGGVKVSLSTKGRRTDIRYNGGKEIKNAEFEIKKDDGYFRIDVTDKLGRRANTQAYMI